MKKAVITIIVYYFIGMTAVFAQSKSHAKEAIRTIWLAYQGWEARSCTYLEPADYIMVPTTKNITGQNFYSFSDKKKYHTIELIYEGDNIASALFKTNADELPVTLTWDNGRVTGIKIEFLSKCDYTVNYDENGKITGFTGNILSNDKTTVNNIELQGDKIAKVTCYQNRNPENPWIRCITTYTYTPDETVLKAIVYKTDKPNTPENIASDIQAIYKKINKNTFIIKQPYGDVYEIEYNENDEIISKKVIKKESTEQYTYKYVEGKLFKEDMIETENNQFKEHKITVYFSLSDQPESTPEYDKTEGIYKFRENGEWYYVARGSQYRFKYGDSWGKWKYFSR